MTIILPHSVGTRSFEVLAPPIRNTRQTKSPSPIDLVMLLQRLFTTPFVQLCGPCLFSVRNTNWVLDFCQERITGLTTACLYRIYDYVAVSIHSATGHNLPFQAILTFSSGTTGSTVYLPLYPPTNAERYNVLCASPGPRFTSAHSVSVLTPREFLSKKWHPLFPRTLFPWPNTPIRSRSFIVP